MSSRKYFPWLVVATSLSNLTISRGIRSSFAVFLVPMSETFQWSRAEISGVFSLYSFLCGVVAPVMGKLLDRFDVHRIVPISALILSFGLIYCSLTNELWHFYLTFGLIIAVGSTGTSIVPHTLAVSRWFKTRRGLPMSFALMGMGLGIFVVVPVTQYILEHIGWRQAFIWQGIGVLILMAPVSYFVFRRKAPTTGENISSLSTEPAIKSLKDNNRTTIPEHGRTWTLGQAQRTVFFWAAFFIYIFTSIGMSGVVIHLAAYLVDIGYSKMYSAMMLSLLGLISVPGRIIFGVLTDKYSGRYALLTSLICSAIGTFSLLSLCYINLPIMLYIFLCMFGLALGARTTALGPMAANIFQGPHFGVIFGFITMGQSVGATLGPWLMGYFFDLSKDYRISLMFALASFFIAAVFAWFTGKAPTINSQPGRSA